MSVSSHWGIVLGLRVAFVALSACRDTGGEGLLDGRRRLRGEVPEHHFEDIFVLGEIFEFS